ncbi:hypothetical protein M9H77_11491 [Catharanthus roseus]|uniref:Uncharacterized protein n=1 Tax=Catharanthus roseus TaxID=4058 RepID=A0ACC0BEV6_CATRO|nr:hypothetical protein M9H77_11491 [Catharanthus roseus]
MVDYNDLKKKVSHHLTLCVEKFTKGKENFEKLLGSQRSPFDKNGIGYNHSNNFSKQTRFVKASSSLSHHCCIYCEKSVKTKNANIGRGVNIEEGGSSRGRGKGKWVPSGIRAPDKFIYAKDAANFEEWTRNRRKIDVGHRVDLNGMQVGDHIGPGKIYNQNTFKRIGFERNDDGLLIRGGQQGSDNDNKEDDGDEEEGNEPEKAFESFCFKLGRPLLETGRPVFLFIVKDITITQCNGYFLSPSYIY